MKIKAKIEKYNAKEYFESWHKSIFKKEFSDRVTISPNTALLISNYHYGLVENCINKYLILTKFRLEQKSYLDIGSGAGHWIDFFNETFKIEKITSFEISSFCSNELRKKYNGQQNINICEKDISNEDIDFKDEFDVISAIGVLFHIVDDDKWEIAIKNISDVLKIGGIAFVGGEFGEKTENRQFNKVNSFSTWQQRQDAWDKFKNTSDEFVYVNKRVRSLKLWEKVANQNGLIVEELIISYGDERIRIPENNILVLKKMKR